MSRRKKQIAWDLIRFTNIINDLIDVASWYLHDIDPNNGTSPILMKETLEESTVDWLKTQVVSCYNNCVNYYSTLLNYIGATPNADIISALADEDIVASELRAELDVMKNAILYVKNNFASATTKTELDVFGDYLDANIPKLDLVRRPWAQV